MTSWVILQASLSLATLPPMLPDTPPPLPIPVARLLELKTMQDVIGATLLADGSRAPASLVLPELVNRHHTLEFMRVHYPPSMRDKTSKRLAVAWIFVDQSGKVAESQLLTSSGHEALDSLSLAVLTVASFRPARLAGEAVGVWVPFPARIPPHDELIAVLKSATDDVVNTPTHTPHTQKPILINRVQVEAAIVRVLHGANRQLAEMKEMFARAQRAGGKTEMWIYIDATGTVTNALVKKTSGNRDLDASALQIARMMRFSPAKNGDQPVDVWIEVPIHFKEQ